MSAAVEPVERGKRPRAGVGLRQHAARRLFLPRLVVIGRQTALEDAEVRLEPERPARLGEIVVPRERRRRRAVVVDLRVDQRRTPRVQTLKRREVASGLRGDLGLRRRTEPVGLPRAAVLVADVHVEAVADRRVDGRVGVVAQDVRVEARGLQEVRARRVASAPGHVEETVAVQARQDLQLAGAEFLQLDLQIVLAQRLAELLLSLDGEDSYNIEIGDKIIIKKSDKFAEFIRIKNDAFFEILNTKLAGN